MPEIEITITRIQYVNAGHTHINIYYGDGTVDQDVMYPSGVPAKDQPIDDWIFAGGVIRAFPGTVLDVRFANREHDQIKIQYELAGWVNRPYPSQDPFIDDAIADWVSGGNTMAPFLGDIVDIRYIDRHESAVKIEYDNGNIEQDVAYPGDLDEEIETWVFSGHSIKSFFSDADRLVTAKKAKINRIRKEALARIEKAEAGMNPDNPNVDPELAKMRELKRKTLESYWITRAIKTKNLNWVTAADQATADQYMNVLIWMNNTRKEAAEREDEVNGAITLTAVKAVTPTWPSLT